MSTTDHGLRQLAIDIVNELDKRREEEDGGEQIGYVEVTLWNFLYGYPNGRHRADRALTATGPAKLLRNDANMIVAVADKFREARGAGPWSNDNLPGKDTEFARFVLTMVDGWLTVAATGPGSGAPDKQPREPGCQCHQEIGDSPCRVHGEEEDEPATPPSGSPPGAAEAKIKQIADSLRDRTFRGVPTKKEQ